MVIFDNNDIDNTNFVVLLCLMLCLTLFCSAVIVFVEFVVRAYSSCAPSLLFNAVVVVVVVVAVVDVVVVVWLFFILVCQSVS